MTEDQIPDFVEAVTAIGCEMCAIGTFGYVIGEADLPEQHRKRIAEELRRINAVFGERDHLKNEIIAYLRRIGRVFELPTAH
jgi:hypothetical protein